MAIQRVQSASNATNNGTTCTATLGAATGSNNLLVAFASANEAPGDVTVTKGAGGWTGPVGGIVNNTGKVVGGAFYRQTTGGVADSFQVTTSAARDIVVHIVEYSGFGNLGVATRDNSAQSSGINFLADSGTTSTTANDNELWVGALANVNNTSTLSNPTNGFTQFKQNASGSATAANTVNQALFEKIVSKTGTANVSATISGTTARGWVGNVITFYNVPPPVQPIGEFLYPPLQIVIKYSGATTTFNGTGADYAADNIQFANEMPGGHTSFSCRVDDSARRNSLALIYGAKVTVSVDSSAPGYIRAADKGSGANSVVWQGYLRTPLRQPDGTCNLTAIGWRQLVEERNEPMMWRTDGLDSWAQLDDDPFGDNFNNSPAYDVSINKNSMNIAVRKGDSIQQGAQAGLAWWHQSPSAGGFNVKRVSFKINPIQNASNMTNNFEVRVRSFSGPGAPNSQTPENGWGFPDSSTQVRSTLILGGTASVANSTMPMISVWITRTGTTNSNVQNTMKWDLSDFQLWGDGFRAPPPADWNTYTTEQIIKDMLVKMGWDNNSTLIQTSTTNALPYWHEEGSWSEIFDDLVTKEGRWKWALWEIPPAGSFPQVEFRDWNNGPRWRVYAYNDETQSNPAHTNADIQPADDIYTDVRVYYTLTGNPRLRMYDKPIAGTTYLTGLNPSRARIFEHTIDAPQRHGSGGVSDTPDQVKTVAANLAAEYANARWTGTIGPLTYAYDIDNSVVRNAYMIRAGDRVTVDDFPGGSTTFRVTAVDYSETEVTLTVGHIPTKLHKLFGHHHKKHQRKHHHGGGH